MTGISRTLYPALLLAAAVVLPAPSAMAQTGPAADPKVESPADIVILGQSSKERERTAHAFVRNLTVLSPTDPTARFEPDIYCPVVFGLSETHNEQIAARMRQVATAAGVKPAPPGCIASAFVFIVEKKKPFLKAFAKQEPVFFYGMTGEPHDEPGPAVAWLLTQDFDPQHMPLGRKVSQPRLVSSVAGGSRILSMITRAVAASVVVVEREALVGFTTTQIADYALMRSLVDPLPNSTAKIRDVSILSLLDAPMGSETPQSLTAWDLGYLKGRYTGDPRFFANKQGAIIAATIRREVEEHSAAGN